MKRILAILLASIIGATAVYTPTAVAVDTNNFTITSFDIQYELSRSSEGSSVLKTIETIAAEFPTADQNHGLERYLPSAYNSHPTGLKIESVTDADGKTLKYSENNRGGQLLLRIGNPESYVHGAHTYRIVYTQQDVTRTYGDTGRTEWYWDTNGTQWRVPIKNLTVTARIAPELQAAMSSSVYCYFGKEGDSERCDVTQKETGAYTTGVRWMEPGENVTLAVGFDNGTFREYTPSLMERIMSFREAIQPLTITIAIAAVFGFSLLAHRRSNRVSELKPIVVEYIPPKNASVMVAARLSDGQARSVFAAQLIDLAVRHYIAIIETKPKSWRTTAEYELEIIQDIATLRDEEREILNDMFGHEPQKGERVALKSLKNNVSYQMRTRDNVIKADALIKGDYNLRAENKEASAPFYHWAKVLLVLAIVTLSIWLAIAVVVVYFVGSGLRPLTDEGLALRRYIMGLDTYIKASEQERLKFLQGPDTAEKIGYSVNTDDPRQLVKLYERTLPYAILFGREKEWGKRLEMYYQTTQEVPTWYYGATVFNAATFSSGLQSFARVSAASAGYSAGTSSSSGGSRGGGFSGGGGGGGGGGGW